MVVWNVRCYHKTTDELVINDYYKDPNIAHALANFAETLGKYFVYITAVGAA